MDHRTVVDLLVTRRSTSADTAPVLALTIVSFLPVDGQTDWIFGS